MTERAGICPRGVVRPTEGILVPAVAVALAAWPVPAIAAGEPRHDLAIAAGTLEDAVLALARQAGVTIGIGDPSFARQATPALRGRMTVSRALSRLLGAGPARAEPIGANAWRIVAAPRSAPGSAHPSQSSPPPPPPVPGGEIVVTGSKRDLDLRDYPGSAYLLDTVSLSAGEAGRGSEAIIARVPSISSTQLGAGRNKLFIRGLADSSFNGPTPAMVGQYLGEVRLNYNAPDPDLGLYDVRSVEVLEGPQGTLYGAGALGGVVRIVPQPVAMDDVAGAVSLGRSVANRGRGGWDVAGMANLPILADRIALRAVAFHIVEGGYIDDQQRGLKDVNRVRRLGGRAALRLLPGDGWSVELGLVLQNIDTRDSQYAERGLPPLTRRSSIAQPFDNDYALASLTVAKEWGPLHFVSATGAVRHHSSSRFDFTPLGGDPTLFAQRNRIGLITSENRLSRRDASGAGWVIGINVAYDDEQLTRLLGPVAAPRRIVGVENSVTQLAAFAEGGFRLFPDLVMNVGARVDFTRLVGEALDGQPGAGEPNRTDVAFLPSISFNWRAREWLTAYLRYQEGYRPGGLSVATGVGNVQRFLGDDLSTVEGGIRLGDPARGPIDGAISLSWAHWEDIQADLVDRVGLPFTANIGTGRVLNAEARIGWRPLAGLRIEAGAFANDSVLSRPAPAFMRSRIADLPNVARLGGRASLAYSWRGGDGWMFATEAAIRYVGHSQLGVAPPFDVRQGDYAEGSASARISRGGYGVSLDITNLFNGEGNRFALGNPFDVADGRQIVPQRPRTIRLGFDARF